MTDDLRVRVAGALCENDGLSPSAIGYGTLWGGYLEAADAVLVVVEPDLTQLRRGMESAKAAHEAVWKLHQERGTRIFELQAECGRLRDERDRWRSERNELAAKHATTVDLLSLEHERANAAIRREEVTEEHLEEKDKECEALRGELAALREAYETKPAGMRLDGPLWPFLAGSGTTETDELRTTIVSQAREIARLKGERA